MPTKLPTISSRSADGLFDISKEYAPATLLGYSDRHAGWVEQITNLGKRLVFRRGKAALLNGADSGQPDALVSTPGGFCAHVSGTQRWQIEIDPTAGHEIFTFRPSNGRWVRLGESAKNGTRLIPGHSHHYDFNF